MLAEERLVDADRGEQRRFERVRGQLVRVRVDRRAGATARPQCVQFELLDRPAGADRVRLEVLLGPLDVDRGHAVFGDLGPDRGHAIGLGGDLLAVLSRSVDRLVVFVIDVAGRSQRGLGGLLAALSALCSTSVSAGGLVVIGRSDLGVELRLQERPRGGRERFAILESLRREPRFEIHFELPFGRREQSRRS